MNKAHKKYLTRNWRKLSLAEQLGNIGSEVNRAIYWRESNEPKYAATSLYRALELLDFTIVNLKCRSSLKELLRLREVLCDFCLHLGQYEISPLMLQRYFFPFALKARKNRNL